MNEYKWLSKDRLIEIATEALYGLIEDDAEQAKIFFEETLDLDEKEKEFFGVEHLWNEEENDYE